MDFTKISAVYVLAVASVTIAISVGYWLVVIKGKHDGMMRIGDIDTQKRDKRGEMV